MAVRPSLLKLTRMVGRCYACESMAHCHVLGESNGPAHARVMFVGEAPGRYGAGRSGVPFGGVYVEFDGAHEFGAWKTTLPSALRWALPAAGEQQRG